jgi:DNA-binding phage protein
MATETLPFDAARFVTSAELLADALASGDAGYIAVARRIIARARAMTEAARRE